jgi:hypothetical protein
MSNPGRGNHGDEMAYLIDVELSERELFFRRNRRP